MGGGVRGGGIGFGTTTTPPTYTHTLTPPAPSFSSSSSSPYHTQQQQQQQWSVSADRIVGVIHDTFDDNVREKINNDTNYTALDDALRKYKGGRSMQIIILIIWFAMQRQQCIYLRKQLRAIGCTITQCHTNYQLSTAENTCTACPGQTPRRLALNMTKHLRLDAK